MSDRATFIVKQVVNGFVVTQETPGLSARGDYIVGVQSFTWIAQDAKEVGKIIADATTQSKK